MKLYIDERFDRQRVDIYLFSPKYGSTEYWFYEDGELTIRSVKAGVMPDETIKPILSVSIDVFGVLLHDLTEYAQMRGIKVEREDKLSGKLEATEKHLSDLRTIAFHALKINESKQ